MKGRIISLPLVLLSVVFSFGLSLHAQKAELVVQTKHSSFISALAFSPDGKLLASASGGRAVKLWDLESGKELRTFQDESESVLSIQFLTPDGKILAVRTRVHIGLWEIQTGKELRRFTVNSGNLTVASFSDDGKLLALGNTNGKIELRDVAADRELAALQGHTDSISALLFSRNGKTLVSASRDQTIKVWNVESREVLRTIPKTDAGYITSIVFKPGDEQKLGLATSYDIELWDLNSGEKTRTFSRRRPELMIEVISFSPDGTTLASIGAGTVELWDLASETESTVLKVPDFEIVARIASSPDGKILAGSGRDSTIIVWDIAGAKTLRTLRGHSSRINSISISSDGKMLASANEDQEIRLWDMENWNGLQTITACPESARNNFPPEITFSPVGRILVTACWDQTVKLWDPDTGKELRTLRPGSLEYTSSFYPRISFSPDGKILASEGEKEKIQLWNVETGTELRPITGNPGRLFRFHDEKTIISLTSGNLFRFWNITRGVEIRSSAAKFSQKSDFDLSPDGKILAWAGDDDDVVNLRNEGNGTKWISQSRFSNRISSISFDHNGKVLAAGGGDGTIRLLDVLGKTEKTLKGHAHTVTSLAFSRDGKTLVSGSLDTKINVWDLATGKVLASLIALNKNDWAVVTPGGLFDASPGGRKLMHFIVGLEPVTLEQMKTSYYVPGLLQNIFKGAPLPNVELFSKQDLFPSVEYEPLQPGQRQLKLKLINRGGGIGPVQVLINGKEVINDARPGSFDPGSPAAVITVDLSNASIRPGEENLIEVVARNSDGSLSTSGARGADIFYLASGTKSSEIPNVYVIVAGISDYTGGDQLKLSFAAKDGEDFARAIELGATRLIGDKNKIHIRLLTSVSDPMAIKFTSPDAKVTTATKADFKQAFEDFKGAKPNDVFIVYLAGHGVSLNLNQNPNQAGGDSYLYLTQEATTTDKSILSGEKSRQAMAISGEELKELMKGNKATGKLVLILDTCAAGALSNSLVGKREPPADQIRALETLKDSTGFYVLMGSAADAVSYEASQYGQGLLTYSLLYGMKGATLREDNLAFVTDLFNYVRNQVPDMARNIGGIQRPLILVPDVSDDFPIGQFTEEEQKRIILSNSKPRILRPTLINKEKDYDDQEFTKIFDAELRRASKISARGEETLLVFVDTNAMEGAHKPSGTYIVRGDKVTITVKLIRNNVPENTMVITGKVSEKESLMKEIVVKIGQAAKRIQYP